jgi:hypothetical protein
VTMLEVVVAPFLDIAGASPKLAFPEARAWASPDFRAGILSRSAMLVRPPFLRRYLRFSGLFQRDSAYSINLGYSRENRAAPAAEEEKGRGYRGMAT